MKKWIKYKIENLGKCLPFIAFIFIVLISSCAQKASQEKETLSVSAESILGNPQYQAISYGGYRHDTRDKQPTVEELKEDMRILSAMGIKLIRTYNVHLAHASNVLKAIQALKAEESDFEMYVMLGAWIDCKNAWTDKPPIHSEESERNEVEIAKTVSLANEYPDIVKIIAVGNEAMVKWAAAYYVEPGIVLKWVNHLQELKNKGKLPKDLWITSSDNFASWGGGAEEYHVPELDSLIRAVDYISMHTYPMHDTHYNPEFWQSGSYSEDKIKNDLEQIDDAVLRAKSYAQSQYNSVKDYIRSIGVDKPIHIGETGWASSSDGHYGPEGSKACDEYKQSAYYKHMREWTKKDGISCFFFEAFDEQWKDANNSKGSENHFGLFTIDGKAKYAIWDLVDEGVFKGLSRGGNTISKTFSGQKAKVMETVLNPAWVKIKY